MPAILTIGLILNRMLNQLRTRFVIIADTLVITRCVIIVDGPQNAVILPQDNGVARLSRQKWPRACGQKRALADCRRIILDAFRAIVGIAFRTFVIIYNTIAVGIQ